MRRGNPGEDQPIPGPSGNNPELQPGGQEEEQTPRKKQRRFRRCSTGEDNIVNLSQYQPDTEERHVLNLGLNFIPTPISTNNIHSLKDALVFNRRVTLTHLYHNSRQEDRTHNPKQDIFPREPKFNKIIPQSQDIKTFTNLITNGIKKTPKKSMYRPNLTQEQLKAVKSLADNKDIIIKMADKGGAVVIQDQQEYVTKNESQLNNKAHYVQTATDQTPKNLERISLRLITLAKAGQLPSNAHKILLPQNPRTSPFYTLPKIHKAGNPGRPIVSGINSPTDIISGVIDKLIRIHVQNVPSYIKDTRDFIRAIDKIGLLQEDDFMCTIDVSALYTSIPHDEGILATVSYVKEAPHQDISPQVVEELMSMVLKMNTMTFNNKYYRQVQGTAMGTKMAPSYANLFMARLEQDMMNKSQLQPKVWRRYIDDIFAIFHCTEDELVAHLQHLNTLHPTIKFTHEYSRNEINFLDVKVQRNPDNSLRTSLYTKPTDRGQYLHHKSFHPSHTKEGIAYSQAVRLKLICSTEKDFNLATVRLTSLLVQKGHSYNKTISSIERARALDRNKLIYPEEKAATKIIPFTIDYTPDNIRASTILKEACRFLTNSQANTEFKDHKIIMAFRRSANLRDTLTQSRFPTPEPQKPMSKPCWTPDCITCDIVEHTKTIKSTSTREEHKICGHNTCNTKNVIYAITCPMPRCRIQYVGETGRSARERIREHKQDIRSRRKDRPVSQHFLDHDLEDTDLRVTILDSSAKDTNDRRRLEEAWIITLDTYQPRGLNLKLG